MPNLAQYQGGFGQRKPGPWAQLDRYQLPAASINGYWLLNAGGNAGGLLDIDNFATATINGAGFAWKPGRFGGPAISLGTTGFCVNSTWTESASALSLSIWLQTPASFATNAHVVLNGQTAGNTTSTGPLLQVALNGTNWQFTHKWSTTTGSWSPTGFTISTSTWYHVVVTYAGSATSVKPTFYISGQKYATTTNTTPAGSLNTATGITLGSNAPHANNWNGLIDNLIFWNRVLSDGEAMLLYQQPFALLQQTPPTRGFFQGAAAAAGKVPWHLFFQPALGQGVA
jgi:hypothetical protein